MKSRATKTLPLQKLHLNLELQGDEVTRFLEYKEGQFLRNNSEAGRKLLLERLQELCTPKSLETGRAESIAA